MNSLRPHALLVVPSESSSLFHFALLHGIKGNAITLNDVEWY